MTKIWELISTHCCMRIVYIIESRRIAKMKQSWTQLRGCIHQTHWRLSHNEKCNKFWNKQPMWKRSRVLNSVQMASRSEVTGCKLRPFTTRRKPQVHYQLIYVATLPLSYCYLVKALGWTAADTLHRNFHYASLLNKTLLKILRCQTCKLYLVTLNPLR